MIHGAPPCRCARRRLEKLPTHVAIAISEEPVSLPDVANLVVWAFDAGVSCVSLFDRDGQSYY